MSSSDARRYPRVRPDARAPIRVDITGKGFIEVLYASDISVGGLGVSAPHEFTGGDANDEVELIITIGRARPFKAFGKIRHRSQTRNMRVLGIEFSRLSSEQFALIDAYVQARLKRAAGA